MELSSPSSSLVTETRSPRSSCSCAYGQIFLGMTYIAFVVASRLVFSDECSGEDECQSEGVDNTYRSWGSSYFVAAVCSLLAVHLHVFKSSTRRSGTVAQIFLAGAFALMGIRSQFYPNNGQTDNMGMMENWVVGAVATFFLTLSATAHGRFAMETAMVTPRSKHPICVFFFMHLWMAAIILIAIINMVGSIWCSLSPQLQTSAVVDNFQDNLYWNERQICLQLIGLSENLIWLPYALLWIPVGLLLRAAAWQRPAMVLGLSNTRAALGVIGFHWSTGSMYLVTVSFASWIRHEMELTDDADDTFLEVWNRVYGVEIFHFGILLSAYCAHNLSWTLTIPSSTSSSSTRISSAGSVMTKSPSNDIRPGGSERDLSESRRVRFSEDASTTEVDLEADTLSRTADELSIQAKDTTIDAEKIAAPVKVTDPDAEIPDSTTETDSPDTPPGASSGGKGWSRFFTRATK